jgi:hypothetical protein
MPFTAGSMDQRRPAPSEYPTRYAKYVDLVDEVDLVAAMSEQLVNTWAFAALIPSELEGHRYEPEKWSIIEVFGHMLDTERIFAFRALTFARGDSTELHRADQDLYARNGEFGRLSLAQLLEEWIPTRHSTVALFRHLPPSAWDRTGVIGGTPITVRAIGYVMLGHERYHLNVIRSKYLDQPAT